MTPIRLETVHPALVHFTIGALPIIVVAYAVAAWRRSHAWTLAGDVAVVISAAITLATASFGLVSNFVVPWPGGVALWRWLHLGLGVASTVLLVAFAATRLALRRRNSGTGPRTFAAALAMAIVVAATGWIGGEVLVFRSGIAVTAAGDGALAPPAYPIHTPPRDFLDAMDQVRASWAVTTSELAWMLVHQPRDDRYASIRREAEHISKLADWMSSEGGRTLRDGSRMSAPHTHDEHGSPHGSPEHPDHAEHDEHDDHDEHEPHAAPASPAAPPAPMTRAEHMALMAETLSGDADDIAEAATKKDLPALARAVGEMGSLCADCHEELRWPPRAAHQ